MSDEHEHWSDQAQQAERDHWDAEADRSEREFLKAQEAEWLAKREDEARQAEIEEAIADKTSD